jgi:hypothetical protein
MCGENVDGTGAIAANMEAVELQGISYLSVLMRQSITAATWGAMTTGTKYIITEYLSRLIGASCIAYNMAGFTSRIEAEDMLNVHFARMRAIERILVDQKAVTYMVSGA